MKMRRARSFAQFTLSGQSEILRGVYPERQGEILRGVYPERQGEILRCAQDDSEGFKMTAWEGFSATC
jgi:hypothetical protein